MLASKQTRFQTNKTNKKEQAQFKDNYFPDLRIPLLLWKKDSKHNVWLQFQTVALSVPWKLKHTEVFRITEV